MNRFYATFLTFFLSFLMIGTLSAADDLIFRDLKFCKPEVRKRSAWAGFGHLNARAHEYVYGGPGGPDGNQLSQLIWDAHSALTFNLGFEGEINDRWGIFAETVISLGIDDTSMKDFDWTDPTTASWTDRSIHPNTDLNHYVQIDMGIDYDLLETECFTFGIRGGFRYTDISFDASGGSYIYSSPGNFRDLTGNFPNDVGISYRQRMRGFYIGPKVKWEVAPRLTFNIEGLAGVTFNSNARDHHWRRSTLFRDDLESTAFYGGSVGIDFAVKPNLIFYVEGAYNRYNQTEGKTVFTDPTGTFMTGPNAAGAALETTQINAGVKINGWKKELFPKQKKW